jgi:hypothetical protein
MPAIRGTHAAPMHANNESMRRVAPMMRCCFVTWQVDPGVWEGASYRSAFRSMRSVTSRKMSSAAGRVPRITFSHQGSQGHKVIRGTIGIDPAPMMMWHLAGIEP